jgi:hypothetical protein
LQPGERLLAKAFRYVQFVHYVEPEGMKSRTSEMVIPWSPVLAAKRSRRKYKRLTNQRRAEIVAAAKSDPRLLGLDFDHWSLRSLAKFIGQSAGHSISYETVRRALNQEVKST